MITTKYKRPTQKEHGHTDIFNNGEYIGYIMPDRSPYRTVGQNWVFVSKVTHLVGIAESNRAKLMKRIKKDCKEFGE